MAALDVRYENVSPPPDDREAAELSVEAAEPALRAQFLEEFKQQMQGEAAKCQERAKDFPRYTAVRGHWEAAADAIEAALDTLGEQQ